MNSVLNVFESTEIPFINIVFDNKFNDPGLYPVIVVCQAKAPFTMAMNSLPILLDNNKQYFILGETFVLANICSTSNQKKIQQ